MPYDRWDVYKIIYLLHASPLLIQKYFWHHFHQWQMIFWQIVHEAMDRKKTDVYVKWMIWKISQHPNCAWHLHQCHVHSCNDNQLERIIKSFKGLAYANSLSCCSCDTNWLVCTKCMERQSNSHKMNTHVEICSGIIIHLSKILNRNLNTTSLTMCQ